jgi:UDP-GlcNAc:undecaprenyl-phosphate GlcNAc-1-phosphate transferase
MTKRVMKGRSPFHADKHHLHHILLRLGFGDRGATGFIIFLTALFSSIAFAGTVLKVPEHYLFMVFVAYFVICFMVSLNLRQLLRTWSEYRRQAGQGHPFQQIRLLLRSIRDVVLGNLAR